MKELDLQDRYSTLKNVLSERKNSEDSFLKNIVRKLNSALLADFTFVGKCNENNTIDTLAVYHDGKYLDNFTYETANTPCETVVNEHFSITAKEVTKAYPKAELLKQLGIEAYAGIALYDLHNNVSGVLVSLFCKPIVDAELADMFLKMFAPQASIAVE